MAVVRIEAFGGEAPSISGQALPGDLAQRNVNLYAGIREFRPLMEDKDTGVAAAGAKSIYRTQRRAGVGGGYNSLGNEGTDSTWLTSANEISYVKGQVNDDATERTYFTNNNGQDAVGNIGIVARQIIGAIVDCTIDPRKDQIGSRYTGYNNGGNQTGTAVLTPRAGPYSNHGLGPTRQAVDLGFLADERFDGVRDSHWFLWATRDLAEMNKVLGEDWVKNNAVIVGGAAAISINGLPFCLIPDKLDGAGPKLLLETKLRAITHPISGAALFSDVRITTLLAAIVDQSRIENRAKELRDRMDAVVSEFSNLVLVQLTPGADVIPPETQQRNVKKVQALRDKAADLNNQIEQLALAIWTNEMQNVEFIKHLLAPEADVPHAFDLGTMSNPRRLGVPSPVYVAPVVAPATIFTEEDARIHMGEVARFVRDAILEATILPVVDPELPAGSKVPLTVSQKDSRYTIPKNPDGSSIYVTGSKNVSPRGGLTSTHGLGPTEQILQYLPADYQAQPWLLWLVGDKTQMRNIFGDQGALELAVEGLGAASNALGIPVNGLPFCLIPDRKDADGKLILESCLRDVKHPVTKLPLFSEAHIKAILLTLIDGSRIATRAPDLAQQLDDKVQELSKLVFGALEYYAATAPAPSPAPAPVPYPSGGSGGDGFGGIGDPSTPLERLESLLNTGASYGDDGIALHILGTSQNQLSADIAAAIVVVNTAGIPIPSNLGALISQIVTDQPVLAQGVIDKLPPAPAPGQDTVGGGA